MIWYLPELQRRWSTSEGNFRSSWKAVIKLMHLLGGLYRRRRILTGPKQ